MGLVGRELDVGMRCIMYIVFGKENGYRNGMGVMYQVLDPEG